MNERAERAAVFGFEEMAPDLPLLPLAARRALDRSGLRLSLAAWKSLALEQRRAIVAAGAADEVDARAVERIAGASSPPPERIDPRPDPDPAGVPQGLARHLGGSPEEARRAWASLRPLDRFVLRHAERVARERGDASRLAAALRELAPVRPKASEPVSTHLGPRGEVHMIDVAEKPATARRAVAIGSIHMRKETLARILRHDAEKGDVLATARIAGIMAAKRTPELIPLCHAVALSHVDVKIEADADGSRLDVTTTAQALDRTGVEMEALVAATTACLTIYDMLKGVDREMVISGVKLLEKSGGRSGDFRRAPGT